MDYFAGLDVSVKDTSVGIVDDAGKIVREVKVASEPEALLAALKNPAYRFKRIGLEAGPLSQWLFSALAEAELPVICVETRHMRAALKAQINKPTATMPVAPRRSPRLRWRAGAERNLSKSCDSDHRSLSWASILRVIASAFSGSEQVYLGYGVKSSIKQFSKLPSAWNRGPAAAISSLSLHHTLANGISTSDACLTLPQRRCRTRMRKFQHRVSCADLTFRNLSLCESLQPDGAGL